MIGDYYHLAYNSLIQVSKREAKQAYNAGRPVAIGYNDVLNCTGGWYLSFRVAQPEKLVAYSFDRTEEDMSERAKGNKVKLKYFLAFDAEHDEQLVKDGEKYAHNYHYNDARCSEEQWQCLWYKMGIGRSVGKPWCDHQWDKRGRILNK